VIYHKTGEDNVWADMISRWAGVLTTAYRLRRVTTRSGRQTSTGTVPSPAPDIRPLDNENFVWPTLLELLRIQKSYRSQASADAQISDDGLFCIDNRIWIPSNAKDLIKRLMIIAHCGPQGHRGRDSMLLTLQRVFSINNLRKEVDIFLRRCLLCLQVKGGKIVPRPWAETLYCNEVNGVLHWDFLYMGESFGNSKYLLVMKDEASHFTEWVTHQLVGWQQRV
jgi:hypothetical protein